jgi:hypothetical protein
VTAGCTLCSECPLKSTFPVPPTLPRRLCGQYRRALARWNLRTTLSHHSAPKFSLVYRKVTAARHHGVRRLREVFFLPTPVGEKWGSKRSTRVFTHVGSDPSPHDPRLESPSPRLRGVVLLARTSRFASLIVTVKVADPCFQKPPETPQRPENPSIWTNFGLEITISLDSARFWNAGRSSKGSHNGA